MRKPHTLIIRSTRYNVRMIQSEIYTLYTLCAEHLVSHASRMLFGIICNPNVVFLIVLIANDFWIFLSSLCTYITFISHHSLALFLSPSFSRSRSLLPRLYSLSVHPSIPSVRLVWMRELSHSRADNQLICDRVFLFSQWDWWIVQINIENRSNDSLQHHSPSGLEVFFPLYWFQTLFCWHKIISFEFLPVIEFLIDHHWKLRLGNSLIFQIKCDWHVSISLCLCVCVSVCLCVFRIK